MIRSVTSWPLAILAMSALLTACGGGSEEPPEITATTTTTVQNKKAQPAHDSKIRQLDGPRLEGSFLRQNDQRTRSGRP